MTRPAFFAGLFVACVCAVLCSLGVWQLHRLAWKEELIATLSFRMQQAPSSITALDLPLNMHEWQPVRVRGRFDSHQLFLVGPRTLDGQVGAHVFTPLIVQGGQRIMVNRGFVPMQGAHPSVALKTPAGTIEVTGVLRVPTQGTFTPDNKPEKEQWYWPDLAAMFGAAPAITDVYLQQTDKRSDQWPRPVAAMPDLPNNHAQYAAFWFGMAGLALGMFILAQRGRRT